MRETKILDVLFRKRPIRLFLRINRDGYTKRPEIYRGKNITPSHAFKVINKLDKAKIITQEKKGSAYKIRLTEKGKKLYDLLCILKELLEEK